MGGVALKTVAYGSRSASVGAESLDKPLHARASAGPSGVRYTGQLTSKDLGASPANGSRPSSSTVGVPRNSHVDASRAVAITP